MTTDEKIDFIYQWVLRETLPSPREIERGMSRVRAYKTVRDLVAAAERNNPWDCLEIWDELDDTQRSWVTNHLDRVNIEKVNACLKIAQEQMRNEISPYEKADELPE